MSAVRIPRLGTSLKRKEALLLDTHKVSNALYRHFRDMHVTQDDKRLAIELGKELPVNVVAEKLELDLVLTAAIIARVV